MKEHYPMLVKAAEELTESEIHHSPELPAFIALDAAISAALDLVNFFNPELGNPWWQMETPKRDDPEEEKILNSILHKAFSVREKLAEYYARVKTNCSRIPKQKEINF